MNDLAHSTRNAPPDVITPPSPVAIVEDLRLRYPKIDERLRELETSVNDCPEKIVDDETAGKAQALLREMAVAKAQWKATRGVEKEPWATIADVVYAHFKKAEDKLDAWTAKVKPRYTAFLETKAENERAAREAHLKAQREESERLAAEAAAAETRRVAAERAEREAQAREETARREAAEAEQRRLRAEAAAATAREEERRLADEKAARIAQEKRSRMADLNSLLAGLNRVEAYAKEDDAENFQLSVTLIDGELSILNARIEAAGDILGVAIAKQRAGIWERLLFLRPALIERLRIKEDAARFERRRIEDQERRERLQTEQEEMARVRLAEETALREARERREVAEAETAAAIAAGKAAKTDVRDARTDQRQARSVQKDAGRDERQAFGAAERTDARAGRLERRLDAASDADLSRTRGDHGTVGSLAHRWECTVIDASLIPLDKLAPYIDAEAIKSAAFRFMREHQAAWGDDDIITDALPGVVFERVPDARIV